MSTSPTISAADHELRLFLLVLLVVTLTESTFFFSTRFSFALQRFARGWRLFRNGEEGGWRSGCEWIALRTLRILSAKRWRLKVDGVRVMNGGVLYVKRRVRAWLKRGINSGACESWVDGNIVSVACWGAILVRRLAVEGRVLREREPRHVDNREGG